MADRVAHPLHLVLPALVQGQLEEARRDSAHPRRCGHAVVELDTRPEPCDCLVRRSALHLGLVHLRHAVAGVREAVRELSVVREQERSGRVGVEPTDRDDARFARNEIDDRPAALRVARRRDHARGLVQ